MPLDVLGRTRATMPGTAGSFPSPTGAGNPVKALFLTVFTGVETSVSMLFWRDWAWVLQFFPTNEECLVAAGH